MTVGPVPYNTTQEHPAMPEPTMTDEHRAADELRRVQRRANERRAALEVHGD